MSAADRVNVKWEIIGVAHKGHDLCDLRGGDDNLSCIFGNLIVMTCNVFLLTEFLEIIVDWIGND